MASNAGNHRETSCAVCGKLTSCVRQGVLACEGCKKFFLRHRNELESLTCSTGSDNCADFSPQCPTKLSCSKCRLRKCFKVGMRLKGRRINKNQEMAGPIGAKGGEDPSGFASGEDEEDRQDPQTMAGPSHAQWPYQDEQIQQNFAQPAAITMGLVQSPMNIDAMNAEVIINSTVNAHSSLDALVVAKSLIKSGADLFGQCDAPTLWSNAMKCFSQSTYAVLPFVKKLPGYSSLSVADRCLLFGKSMTMITSCRRTMPPAGKTVKIFGFDDTSQNQFLYHFPFFIPVIEEFEEIAAVVAEWNPTVVELALLEAFIFYQATNGQNLENTEKVYEISYWIDFSLKSYLSSQHSHPSKTSAFFKVLTMLKRTAVNHGEVMARFNAARPSEMSENRIFAETVEVMVDRKIASGGNSTTNNSNSFDHHNYNYSNYSYNYDSNMVESMPNGIISTNMSQLFLMNT